MLAQSANESKLKKNYTSHVAYSKRNVKTYSFKFLCSNTEPFSLTLDNWKQAVSCSLHQAGIHCN